MFARQIGVDWSGGGRSDESQRGLAVAICEDGGSVRQANWFDKRRSRDELVSFLIRELHPSKPRTIVGMDFCFGLPAGAGKLLFGKEGWQESSFGMRALTEEHGTARAVAQAVNARPEFGGHGPYRFDENRNDFRFYLDHGVRYYREVETFVPQALSPWYVGSGAAVGFSTITGMAAIGELLQARSRGECDFRVWPFEDVDDERHVLAEVYPAIWPHPETEHASHDERDAAKIVAALSKMDGPPHSPPNVGNSEGWILSVS
jgi:hypothetical protein